MTDDLALRWTVTVLFAFSSAGYVDVLVAQHVRWTCTVNHLLHLVMAVAMMVMAWPVGMDLPTVGLMGFFLLAAVCFVLVAARASSGVADRLTNGYNAVMSSAMVWMYAVMNGSLPGQTSHLSDHHGPSGSSSMAMVGTDIFGPMSATAGKTGWITTVNAIATIGFAVAVLYWLYRYFVERKASPAPYTAHLSPMGLLGQGFMAAGIALMFAAML
ncbi:MAG: DUF5134 domain-containing protein [Mycobacterium sp.]